MKRSFLPCLATLFFCALPSWAQSSAGTITGRVLDPSGHPIAAAAVILTRPDTGEARNLSSDATGEFVFTSVQPGTYDLAVKATGFKTFDKKGLALSASDHLTAGDLPLQVGSISES